MIYKYNVLFSLYINNQKYNQIILPYPTLVNIPNMFGLKVHVFVGINRFVRNVFLLRVIFPGTLEGFYRVDWKNGASEFKCVVHKIMKLRHLNTVINKSE